MKTLTISVKSGNCCGSTPVAISEINRVRPSRDDLESGESQPYQIGSQCHTLVQREQVFGQ